MSFQERNVLDESLSFIWRTDDEIKTDSRDQRRLTAFRGKLLEIDIKTDVVFRLGLGAKHRAVFAFEHIEDAILKELGPAPDAHGEEEGGLAIWGG